MPSLSKIFFKLLRTVSYLVALILTVIVAFGLLLIFYISPRLDQWREPIQEQVQKHTGMPIEFGGLALSWQGFNPQLVLKEVGFQESALSQSAMRMPRTSVEELRLYLEPSLTFWKSGLLSIDVEKAHLPLLIDAEGDVWIGQHRLPMADVTFSQLPETEQAPSELEEVNFIAALSSYLTQDFSEQIKLLQDDPLFEWIRSVSVNDLHLTVRDASSLSTGDLGEDEKPGSILDFDLDFKEARVSIENERIQSFVAFQSELLSEHDIVIESLIDYSLFSEKEKRAVSGHLNLRSRYLEPRQLFFSALDELQVDQLVIEQFDFDAELINGHWEDFKAYLQLGNFSMPQTSAERIQLTLEGQVADALAVFVAHGHPYQPLRFEAHLLDGWFHEPLNFRHDFTLAEVALQGSYVLDDANLPVLSFQALEVRDPNVELNARGTWHALGEGSNGHIRLEGDIQHLVASYLPRFLPTAIDSQALDWLDGAFINGTLDQGRFVVNGLADHYPYGRHPSSGINEIVAEFKDFSLDFHHQAEEDKWPVLHMDQGTFRFINDEILIDANRGWMNNLSGEQSVVYDNLHAVISSLERDTMLEINANAESTAEQFLVLMQETPLSALLNHALDDSEAKGELRSSLAIQIPLHDMEESTISGKLYTHDAEFRLNSAFPKATEVSGALSFNEKFLSVDDVKAQFLGGPAYLNGDIGRPGHALTITGQLSGEGIYDYYPLKGLQQLKGLTHYHLDFNFLEDNAFDAILKSNLQGLSISYPGLYSKPAKESTPLQVQWKRTKQGVARYHDQIVADYDEGATQLNLDFDTDERHGLSFKRGAIAFDEAPIAPESGLFFHGAVDTLEVESLTHWIDNFGFGEGDGSNQIVNGFDVAARELLLGGFSLPEVRMKSQIERFDELKFDLFGPTVEGKLRLEESTETKSSFDVRADFNHLHWRVNHQGNGLYPEDAETAEKELLISEADSPWKINSLNLNIQDLKFYKYHFSNVEALGEAENSQSWRLDKLSIQDEGGHLYGAAYIHNKNEKLIADLNFNINTLDVDGLLSALSLGDNLLTGHGDIQGSLQIHDVLNFDTDDVELNVLGILRDGHINNVGTGATRILALLSIQALSKIPEMNKIFINQGKNSMNYSYLRFHLGLKEGLLWLPDFRLDSPLIGLAAQGHGNLRTDAIDLDVVAVPRLDMSGAAVLTGVLVNPAVGVAAFLSQWLLRSPMEQGLTQRFEVGGTLDNIHIDGVPIDMNKAAVEAEASQGSIIPVIDVPDSGVELVPEVQRKTPAPIIIEQGSNNPEAESLIITPIINDSLD